MNLIVIFLHLVLIQIACSQEISRKSYEYQTQQSTENKCKLFLYEVNKTNPSLLNKNDIDLTDEYSEFKIKKYEKSKEFSLTTILIGNNDYSKKMFLIIETYNKAFLAKVISIDTHYDSKCVYDFNSLSNLFSINNSIDFGTGVLKCELDFYEVNFKNLRIDSVLTLPYSSKISRVGCKYYINLDLISKMYHSAGLILNYEFTYWVSNKKNVKLINVKYDKVNGRYSYATTNILSKKCFDAIFDYPCENQQEECFLKK